MICSQTTVCLTRFVLENIICLNLVPSLLSKLPFSLVQQSLKEAFEVFCNKTVAGRSSAELLAASCDNILHKGGIESDEDIEETLEKVCLLEFS